MDSEQNPQSIELEPQSYSLNRWMTDNYSQIKHLRISEMSLPGAHNCGMDKGIPNIGSYTACQDYGVRHQLDNGVRVLDIRLRWYQGEGFINEGMKTFHSAESGRTFGEIMLAIHQFHLDNPGEIIVLDINRIEAYGSGFVVPYKLFYEAVLRDYGHKLLPVSALSLTFEQIKQRYPGPRIALATVQEVWTHEGPRDRTYFWDKITHQWVGDGLVSPSRLHTFMQGVMSNPPFSDYPWSMSATCYDIGGPRSTISELCQWYPTGGDWQRKSSIINFDFVTRENAAFIRQCIESNIGKPLRSRLAILRPSEGEAVYGPRLTVAGVGAPGATVTFRGANKNWTGVVDNEGTWEISVVTPPQVYELSCRQQLNGHDSRWTSPITIQYLETPLSPEIRNPANGSMVGNRKPDINGRGAAPGASVEFYDTKEPPTYYGSTRADSIGSWFGTPEADLPGQEFSLRCLQRLAGVASPFSEPVTFTFMNAPTILAPSNGSEGVSVTTLIRGEGALPGATVSFYRSGDFILDYGRAVADQNGQWSGFNSRQFPLGQFSLACKQTLNGVGSEPASVTFNVGIPAPRILTPADGSEVDSINPVISGEGGTPGALVRFYEQGSFNYHGQANVGESGTWRAMATTGLPPGRFTLVCNQTLGESQSGYSAPSTFTVLDKPPAPTDLSVTPDKTSAYVEWQNSSPNVIYFLYTYSAGGEQSTLSNKVTLNNLGPDREYTFRVRSMSRDFKLSEYASITFKTSSGGGSEPTNFHITENAKGSVSFAWDSPVEGANNVIGYVFKVFIVERETHLGVIGTFTLENLIPLIPIAVGVRCKFANGTESDWARLPVHPQP